MKRIFLTTLCLLTMVVTSFGQGAHNIQINEVMTNNKASIQDEYGRHNAWVELANTAFSTYNIRGMYITTNRAVLNKDLSAPKRTEMMSPIPSGDGRTLLTARQHIVFYLNSNPSEGSLHITAKADSLQPLWIALYDGNGVDLIDSVSVPALTQNEAYARTSDGDAEWQVRKADDVTPGIANHPTQNDKIAKTKAEDPHGFAITILAMGTVFFCLALLYVFFRLLGIFMDHQNKAKEIANAMPLKPVTKTVEAVDEVRHKTSVIMKDGLDSKGIDKEVYIAVISMALKQYQDDVHDVESGIITIRPSRSAWSAPQFNNLNK